MASARAKASHRQSGNTPAHLCTAESIRRWLGCAALDQGASQVACCRSWQCTVRSNTTAIWSVEVAAAACTEHEVWQPGCQARWDYAFSAAAIDFNTARCRSSFKWAASI